MYRDVTLESQSTTVKTFLLTNGRFLFVIKIKNYSLREMPEYFILRL